MSRGAATVVLCCSLFGGLADVGAQGMQPLSDTAMSSVRGRDGVSFDLANFSMSGDARLTYYAPAPSTASLYIANFAASRSDDPNTTFSDPYRLDIMRRAPGWADVINLAFPLNANGLARWQVAYDWGVNADAINFDGGSMVFKDVAFYGGGMQLTTPRVGEGIGFGLALRMDIGNFLLRPRGRDDIGVAVPASVTEQMHLDGIHVGAVDSDGNFINAPWRIADVTSQPGVLNAVTDASGNSRLHIGIDWPDVSGAASGGVKIDNLTFRSDITGNLDLGSSRIGSMQIQYLDIKFKP